MFKFPKERWMPNHVTDVPPRFVKRMPRRATGGLKMRSTDNVMGNEGGGPPIPPRPMGHIPKEQIVQVTKNELIRANWLLNTGGTEPVEYEHQISTLMGVLRHLRDMPHKGPGHAKLIETVRETLNKLDTALRRRKWMGSAGRVKDKSEEREKQPPMQTAKAGKEQKKTPKNKGKAAPTKEPKTKMPKKKVDPEGEKKKTKDIGGPKKDSKPTKTMER